MTGHSQVGQVPCALKWRKELKGAYSLTMANIAVKQGDSRARVTQIMNLLKLDMSIQNKLQELSAPTVISYFNESLLPECQSVSYTLCLVIEGQGLKISSISAGFRQESWFLNLVL